jgi:ParB-like chromosome segregation protein Spo0J
MNITTLPLSALHGAPWRATHCLKPDQRVLVQSLTESGWLLPLVATPNGTLVDGHYRWQLARENKRLAKVLGDLVPVHVVDVDEVDAMVMHLRLNMGRGRVVGHKASQVLRLVLRSGKYTDVQLQEQLRLNDDEWDLLVDGDLVKKRNVPEHRYSPAWVPVEVPEGAAVVPPVIERPPNPDQS